MPLTADERFHVLYTGEIDILIRTTTCTFARDTILGLHDSGTSFCDGQGVLVSKSLGAQSLFLTFAFMNFSDDRVAQG